VEKPSEDPEFNVETSECERPSVYLRNALHRDWWREAVCSQTTWRLQPLPVPMPAAALYAPGAAPVADAVPSIMAATHSYRLPQRVYADPY
jgi:hypothetical protein